MAIRQKEHQVSTVDLLYIIALLCILGIVLLSFTNCIGIKIGEDVQYIKLSYSIYRDNNIITFGTTSYTTRYALLGLIGLTLPVIGGFLAYMINNPKNSRLKKIISSSVSMFLIIVGMVGIILYPNIWVEAQKETTLYPLIQDGTASVCVFWTQYFRLVLCGASIVLIAICIVKTFLNKNEE